MFLALLQTYLAKRRSRDLSTRDIVNSATTSSADDLRASFSMSSPHKKFATWFPSRVTNSVVTPITQINPVFIAETDIAEVGLLSPTRHSQAVDGRNDAVETDADHDYEYDSLEGVKLESFASGKRQPSHDEEKAVEDEFDTPEFKSRRTTKWRQDSVLVSNTPDASARKGSVLQLGTDLHASTPDDEFDLPQFKARKTKKWSREESLHVSNQSFRAPPNQTSNSATDDTGMHDVLQEASSATAVVLGASGFKFENESQASSTQPKPAASNQLTEPVLLDSSEAVYAVASSTLSFVLPGSVSNTDAERVEKPASELLAASGSQGHHNPSQSTLDRYSLESQLEGAAQAQAPLLSHVDSSSHSGQAHVAPYATPAEDLLALLLGSLDQPQDDVWAQIS